MWSEKSENKKIRGDGLSQRHKHLFAYLDLDLEITWSVVIYLEVPWPENTLTYRVTLSVSTLSRSYPDLELSRPGDILNWRYLDLELPCPGVTLTCSYHDLEIPWPGVTMTWSLRSVLTLSWSYLERVNIELELGHMLVQSCSLLPQFLFPVVARFTDST